MATQFDIAKKLGIDRTTVSKILTCYPGSHFPADLRTRVFATAKAMGYNPGRVLRRRKAERYDVEWPVHVEVHLEDGAVAHTQGRAIIRNVSATGALVADLEIEEHRGLPTTMFQLHCLLDPADLHRGLPVGPEPEVPSAETAPKPDPSAASRMPVRKGPVSATGPGTRAMLRASQEGVIHLVGTPIRFDRSAGHFGVGVEFRGLDPRTMERLTTLIGADKG